MPPRPGERLIVLACNDPHIRPGASGTVFRTWPSGKGTVVVVDWDDPDLARSDAALIEWMGDRWTTMEAPDE